LAGNAISSNSVSGTISIVVIGVAGFVTCTYIQYADISVQFEAMHYAFYDYFSGA